MGRKRKQGLSIRGVVIASSILLAVFAWGFAAGLYANDMGESPELESNGVRPRVGAILMLFQAIEVFVYNSLAQIPNVFAVIGNAFAYHLWLPIAFAVLQTGLLAGGVLMQRLERELAEPASRRRSRR